MAENKLESIVIKGVEYDIGLNLPITKSDTSTYDEEIIISDDDEQPIIIVNKEGIYAKNYYDLNENSISNLSSKNMCVEFDANGEDLYVAYIDEYNKEYTYWFKKCMANELYTFYRVGYRNTNRQTPDTININNDSDIKIINATGSDNIGPMATQYGWVGGNHHYPDEDSSSHKIYKTAKNEGYEIFVDGRKLVSGNKVYGDNVIIKVHNIIYDPSIAPDEEDDILSVKLSDEYVVYTINKNNIEISLKQAFSDTTDIIITNYYGMQSMFMGETSYMTPNGRYYNWEESTINQSTSFLKSVYPNFNRFIERNTTLITYQSGYLIPSKLGKHEYINDNDFIFTHSSNKMYHHIISNKSINGMTLCWSGVYTFFHTPIVDDEYLFVYVGTVNLKDVIFINTKQNFSGNIDLPVQFYMKKYEVIENTGSFIINNDFIDSEGLCIQSSEIGSLIIKIL